MMLDSHRRGTTQRVQRFLCNVRCFYNLQDSFCRRPIIASYSKRYFLPITVSTKLHRFLWPICMTVAETPFSGGGREGAPNVTQTSPYVRYHGAVNPVRPSQADDTEHPTSFSRLQHLTVTVTNGGGGPL